MIDGCILLFLPADSERTAEGLLRYFVITGVYGIVSMGAQVVYDIEEWSITRATLTHLVITLAGFYGMAFFLGWFALGSSLFWIMTGGFIAAYAVIWCAYYFSYRRNIRKMNEALQKWKSTHP